MKSLIVSPEGLVASFQFHILQLLYVWLIIARAESGIQAATGRVYPDNQWIPGLSGIHGIARCDAMTVGSPVAVDT
jgi:hypothetical protein